MGNEKYTSCSYCDSIANATQPGVNLSVQPLRSILVETIEILYRSLIQADAIRSVISPELFASTEGPAGSPESLIGLATNLLTISKLLDTRTSEILDLL